MFLLKLSKQPTRSILSCRNAGLGDNLLAAANAWYYARISGRSLVICWFASRYQHDPLENAFWQLFSLAPQIDAVPIVKIARIDRLSAYLLLYRPFLWPYPDVLCLADKLAQRLLRGSLKRWFRKRRGEDIVFAADRRQAQEQRMVVAGIDTHERVLIANGCYSPRPELKPFFDSLTLTPGLAERASRFASAHLNGRKIIGVHVRYYDPSLPASNHSPYWADTGAGLSACLAKIEQAIARVAPSDYVVFLATDSAVVQAALVARIDRIVTLEKRFGHDRTQEMHEEVPAETVQESVLEMFLLARSNILVRYPPHSWFSHYASLYAEDVIV